MSFLDEAVYNVEKGAMPPDPKDLEDDDVVNIGEDDMDEGILSFFKQGASDIKNALKGGLSPEKMIKIAQAIIKLDAKQMAQINIPGGSFASDKQKAKFIKIYVKQMYKNQIRMFKGDNDKRTLALKKTIELKEGKLSQFLGGLALSAAALGLVGKINQSDKVLQNLKAKYEQADTKEEKKKIKNQISKRLIFLDTGKSDSSTPMNEEDIELSSDTTFTIDLKHLVKKHMNKGNDKESAIQFTKALMKKLHDKGELKVNGTKVIFKNAPEYAPKLEHIPMELPNPDTPNFLGNDGRDHEGGMAKSQMLKMKKYVLALSNMIEDESQLESWVQAKLTKASDYMSSVYHYLDYQNSKMEEK